MKLKKYLKLHPDLPPAVVEVLRAADEFVHSDTGDDPVPLALALADMLAGKKKPAPGVTAAATTATFATVGAYPHPLPYYLPGVRGALGNPTGGDRGES